VERLRADNITKLRDRSALNGHNSVINQARGMKLKPQTPLQSIHGQSQSPEAKGWVLKFYLLAFDLRLVVN
jgi:hypothetical protein